MSRLSNDARAVFHHLRSVIGRQSGGPTKGSSPVVKSKFADQLHITVTEDFETKLPSKFVRADEGADLPREVDLVILEGSQVDNIPDTEDYISFRVDGSTNWVSEKHQNGRVYYDMSGELWYRGK